MNLKKSNNNFQMDKIDPLNQVARFHKTFQHPILNEPEIPSKQRCDLRVSLIDEELQELKEAIAERDMVEIADALCDLQYVLSGAILEFGLGEKFSALFNEVQRSNMSKACESEEEAYATVAHYKEKKDTDCYYREVSGKYLVFRRGDDKTLKSIKYSPADLSPILNS